MTSKQEAEFARRIAAQMDAALEHALTGGRMPPRPRALRLQGGTIESVELDQDGNVIKPIRCTCGGAIVIHRPGCLAYFLCT